MSKKKTIEQRLAALEAQPGRGRYLNQNESDLRRLALKWANLKKFRMLIEKDGSRSTFSDSMADEQAEYTLKQLQITAFNMLRELAMEEHIDPE